MFAILKHFVSKKSKLSRGNGVFFIVFVENHKGRGGGGVTIFLKKKNGKSGEVGGWGDP